MKKKMILLLALIFILNSLSIFAFADELQIGADIGDILATDIIAKINGFVIPSFNINGSMVVYAKNLSNYGFDVAWNGEKRQVDIALNTDKRFSPIQQEVALNTIVGAKLGDVLYTDIKTFVNGKEVPSFNINGSTALYFRDLKEFGRIKWDEIERISSLNTSHPEIAYEDRLYDASEVSKLVSPAVVYITTFDANGWLVGEGSGFIVDTFGYIVTNFHVIEDAYSAEVKLIDGRVFEVKDVIQFNENRDVAILKINGEDLPVVRLGDSDKIENGEKILAIGSPIGLENTISDGLISNRSREVAKYKYVQISAPISPGSSGGALLNYKAEVVGIITAYFVEGQNLNLAIPINEAKNYITAALNNERTIEGTYLVSEVSRKKSSKNPKYIEIEYSNGNKYVGELKDDLYHGKGTFTWSDGEKYVGAFHLGYLHGRGVIHHIDGKQKTGIWSFGEYIGEKIEAPAKVAAEGITAEEALLYWSEVYGAECYYVYYSYDEKGTFEPILGEDGLKAPFYPNDYYSGYINSIERNSTIYFKVTTVIGGEESVMSETVSATVFDLAAPSGLWAKATSPSTIQVGWDKMPDTDGYYLYRSDSVDGEYDIYIDKDGNAQVFDWDSDYCVEVFGITPGQKLFFKATAFKGTVESDFSKPVSAVTPKR